MYFNERTNEVTNHDVHLLNPRSDVRGHDKRHITLGIQLATRFARESNDRATCAMRCVNSLEDVAGVSGGGDSNQYVALPTQTLDLPAKNLVVALVVTNGR